MKPSFFTSSLLAVAITSLTLGQAGVATSFSPRRLPLSSREVVHSELAKTIQILRNHGIVVNLDPDENGQDAFTIDIDDHAKYKCKAQDGEHVKHPPHSPKNRHHHHPHPHPGHSTTSGIATSRSVSGNPNQSTTTTASGGSGSTPSGPGSSTTTNASGGSVTTTPSGGPILTGSVSVSLGLSTTSQPTATVSKSTGTATIPTPTAPTNQCPQGYKGYHQGDHFFSNDASLIDLHDLTIDLNILNFDNGQKEQNTVQATRDSTCQSSTCCVRPTCPKGYQEASQGQEMILNHDSLIDLEGLDVDLNILNFDDPSTKTAANGHVCSASTCCFRPNSQTTNEDSLIDASGIHIGLCLLSGTC